jgi:hypothetical protein
LALLHERFWADRTDDARAVVASIFLAVIGFLLLVARIMPTGLGRTMLARTWISHQISSARREARRLLIVGAVVLVAYVLPNMLLFRLGSHPFDMGNERLYAYVASQFGLSQLYYLPNIVSFPSIWGGVPYGAAAFPYEPVPGYLFWFIGWLAALGSGGISNLGPLHNCRCGTHLPDFA